MERSIAIIKLVALALLVMAGILSLSFSQAYGAERPQFGDKDFVNQYEPVENPNAQPGTTDAGLPLLVPDERVAKVDPTVIPGVPEPTTLLLLGAGLAALGLNRRRG